MAKGRDGHAELSLDGLDRLVEAERALERRLADAQAEAGRIRAAGRAGCERVALRERDELRAAIAALEQRLHAWEGEERRRLSEAATDRRDRYAGLSAERVDELARLVLTRLVS